MAAHTTVDEYIASFPPEVQAVLTELRRTIRAVVPDGVEVISYGVPSIPLGGRYRVYFAGWKHHVSVYPAPVGDDDYERAVAPYRVSKGTLKFALAQPIPHDVVTRAVELLVTLAGPSQDA